MERYDYDFHCTKLFEEGVSTHRCGDVSIIEQRNDNDCFILDIPAKVEEMFRQNFKLRPEETLLLARDTSLWNNRTEGLVITNRRIVYIPKHRGSIKNIYVINYDSSQQIDTNIDSVLFWNSDESFLAVPKSFFFKTRWKTYDFDRSITQLTLLLKKMGAAHTHHNKRVQLAYIMNKHAEA